MKEKISSTSHKSSKVLIGVGIVIVILLSAILFTLNKDTITNSELEKNTTMPDESEITPAPSIPLIESTDKVIVLSDTLEIDKANEKHKKIVGRVQNTGDTRALSVEITAILYTLNGTRVGEQSTRPLFNDLNPGQISYFEINFWDDVTATYRLSVSSN
ncbi:MAG: FxLYD domain-containing protein [archaeon]|nr:FxLYD domain-containing protein [archaeon]